MSEKVQITYGATTFTRTSQGGASGYGYRSPRWQCDACEASGLGDEFIPGQWAATHARGHIPCPWCQRPTPVVMSGDARVHTGCKKRPKDVQAEWVQAKDQLVTVRSTIAGGEGS